MITCIVKLDSKILLSHNKATLPVTNVILVYFQKKDHGDVLLEKCFYHLDIIEKDYFGLQYTDHNSISVSYLFSVLQCLYS